MKNRIRKTLSLLAAGAMTLAFGPMSSVNAEDVEDVEEVKTFTVSQDDEDILSTLKKEYLELVEQDGTFDINESEIEVDGFDKNITGLQNVTVKISLKSENGVENTVGYDYSENVIIKVEKATQPTLVLTGEEVVLDHGAEWDAYSYIEETNDGLGSLPILKEIDNVDTNTDGEYTAEYTVVDQQGVSTTKQLKVTVRMSEEQIAAQKAAEEAARLAAEAEAIAQAQATATASTETTYTAIATDGANPYSGGWSNCTWGAWQAMYTYRGISLPMWGNAGAWLGNAAASGWATGSTPASGSICVYSHHVAYVVSVSEDGQSVYIVEGGYLGGYMERWVSAYGSVSGQSILGYIYC